MSIGPPNPEIRISQFDLENQRVRGKWPWCCTHTGLDNSIELEWYKSILWFQRYVFCNIWAKCCQLLQVFGPWASPYGANGQITITLHNYRSRQFHRTSSGENSSSGYREMGSASLAGARPAAGPPARAVVTIPLQPGRLRGNKANLGYLIAATGLVILLKFDPNHQFFSPCDLELWCMTLKNNRAPLLCYFKLCAAFRTHWWIQTGVTARKRPIWVKFDDF